MTTSGPITYANISTAAPFAFMPIITTKSSFPSSYQALYCVGQSMPQIQIVYDDLNGSYSVTHELVSELTITMDVTSGKGVITYGTLFTRTFAMTGEHTMSIYTGLLFLTGVNANGVITVSNGGIYTKTS